MTAHTLDHSLAHRAVAPALALAGLFLGACVTPEGLEQETRPIEASSELLAERQPADVAIAPPRDQTGRRDAPLGPLREALSDALVERLYSPLSSTYVDANWVDSSFRGTPPPEALLSVTLTAWDPTRLYSTGFVSMGADLVLFEGADTTGRVLWRATLSENVDMRSGNGRPPGPSDDHLPKAIRRFARQALDGLPARDPVKAHTR